MRCPTCRSPWREQPECSRCGSDLTPLMRVAAEAWRERAAAADAIGAERWSDALHHAREANRLERTDVGVDLLLIAQLVAG
jgi:hypothetical protein